MSLLAVSGLLEGPSTEDRQKHSKFPEGGGDLFIDHVILYKEAKITKTEKCSRIQFILSTMWNMKNLWSRILFDMLPRCQLVKKYLIL